MSRLVEAGHYYKSHGPTTWSTVGWEIGKAYADSYTSTMLMVDDVHPVEDVAPAERAEPLVQFEPVLDHLVFESDFSVHGLVCLVQLQNKSCPEASDRLPKKHRVRRDKDGGWQFQGKRLTYPGNKPTCLLYDLGLTRYKIALGYTTLINVLPEHYAEQQRVQMKLTRLLFPQVTLQVILFRLDGSHWQMPV